MNFRLICADVLDGLRGLVAGSFDCIVTDPPYGERIAAWDSPRSREWHIEWLTEAARVVGDGPIVSFFSRRYYDIFASALREVRGDTPALPMQQGAWIHRQGYAHTPGHLRPEHEPIAISGLLRADADDVRALRSYKTPHNLARKKTLRGGTAAESDYRSNAGFGAFEYTPNEIGPVGGTTIEAGRNKPKDEHTDDTDVQKPLAVMSYWIALACPPGGIVLDPFAGSCTTGVAALKSGRAFCGIDQSQERLDGGRRRLHAAAPLLAKEIA